MGKKKGQYFKAFSVENEGMDEAEQKTVPSYLIGEAYIIEDGQFFRIHSEEDDYLYIGEDKKDNPIFDGAWVTFKASEKKKGRHHWARDIEVIPGQEKPRVAV
jgi:hypothetical protein